MIWQKYRKKKTKITNKNLLNSSNSDSEDDIEPDTVDQEYPSLDSVPSDNSLPGTTTLSPRNSEPPSLTESMQLMDEILSDKTMDRIERIDKLEAILSAATLLPSDPVRYYAHCTNFNTKVLSDHLISYMNITGDHDSSKSNWYAIQLEQFVWQFSIH